MARPTLPLKSNTFIRSSIENYYINANQARENNKKIAWTVASFPVELIYAMDVIPIYPENHAAMCGARHMATEASQAAEAQGYSIDLCHYALVDYGSIISDKSPIGGLPKPDMLLSNNSQCDTVTKWFEILSRHFNVPHFALDVPLIMGDPSKAIIDYFKKQTRECSTFLETHTGRKMDPDKLREVVGLAKRASGTWGEILSMAKNKPSPITVFDAFLNMAPIVTMRGTQEAVDCYDKLKEEMEERVSNHVGAIAEEKYRLYWDNIAIWHKLRELSEAFANAKASVVVASYTNSWAYDFDDTRPLETLAENYTKMFINLDLESRIKIIKKFIEEYSIDGMVLHSNRSCRAYSFGQYDYKLTIDEALGIPSVILESDQVEERFHDEAQVNTRIETFFEALEARGPAH
jgi:bcr-type benzoyl-CoA reductase subunit B